MALARNLFHIDWNQLLNPQVALLEIVLRGSLIYLSLFFLLRLFRSRHAGETGTSDILLIVLIADAVQNAMASEYRSLTEGLTLALTIFFWAFALDWIAFRYPSTRRFIQSGPTCVIKDGTVYRRALRKEFLSEDDLAAMLRHHGVADVSEVSRAFVESDGRISVLKKADR